MKFFKQIKSRAAFTLMEVNLAIFIMAVGILTMVSLYPLGFRENQQSRDDVRSAALAQYVLNQVSARLSSRDLSWNEWNGIINSAQGQAENWGAYCNNDGAPKNNLKSIGEGVFNALAGSSVASRNDANLMYAIVVSYGKMNDTAGRLREDRSRAAISVRVTSRVPDLFAQPVYYTEVHFQGMRR